MKIAVTGASGFIGKSFTAFLEASSINYIALDRLSTSHFTMPPVHNHFYVDYSDVDSLKQKLVGCDCVVHLAGRAHKSLGSNQQHDIQQFRCANVDCLMNVLAASQSAGVRRIVSVSSIGVLGDHTNGTPFSDFSSPSPSQLYAKSKLEAEIVLKSCVSIGSSLEWVILRPPLIYGPNCPGNMEKLIRVVNFLPFIPFGNVASKKSFISISNFIDILYLCLTSSKVAYETFAVSDCDDITVREMFSCLLDGLNRSRARLIPFPVFILKILCSLFGFSSDWRQVSSELIVDSSRFRVATGWSPPYTAKEQLRLAAKSFLM